MKKIVPLSLSIILISCVVSCRQDHKPEIVPNTNNTDTTITTFAEVKPIFELYGCTGCHVQLGGDEASAKSWAGHFNRIVGAIKHESGFRPMPDNGGKLTDPEIAKIEAWYNDAK